MEGLQALVGLPKNVIAHSLVVLGYAASKSPPRIGIGRSGFTITNGRRRPDRFMADTVFNRVESLLKQHGIVFQVMRHEPVFTTAKRPPGFGAHRWRAGQGPDRQGRGGLRHVRRPRRPEARQPRCPARQGLEEDAFRHAEEVLESTGLTPGPIPPFGSLFGLPTHCDERLGESDVINLTTAGDHGISVSMRYADYVLVEKPELGRFAAELEP